MKYLRVKDSRCLQFALKWVSKNKSLYICACLRTETRKCDKMAVYLTILSIFPKTEIFFKILNSGGGRLGGYTR